MNTLKQMIILLSLTGVALCSKKVVDITGGGDCLTINGCTGADTIFIKNGEYIEQIINTGGRFFLGESRDGVVIRNPNGNAIIVGTGGSLYIENLTITEGYIVSGDNNTGDIAYYTLIHVKNCLIKSGIALQYSGYAQVYNSVFVGSGTKIYTPGDSNYNNKAHKIINNLFYNSGNSSISIKGGSGEVTNNIFHSISSTTVYGSSNLVTSYNCFYNVSGDVSGTSNIYDVAADPKLEDIANGDYRPKSDSPLLDVGHPTVTYNDPDGSRSDIGLYGGPNSWGKKPQITAISISPGTVNQGGSITISATATSK